MNVRLSANATQQVTSTNQPDAFGISSVTAGLPSAYGFRKVGARYYDPAFGAFLTRDTDLSQKPYAYCNGDPVNFSDPSGHDIDGWAATGVAAGIAIGLLTLDGFLFATGLVIGGGILVAVIVLSIVMIGASIYAASKLGQSIADGLAGAAEDAGLDGPPLKGIGWKGDNAPLGDTHQDYRYGKGNNWYPQGRPYTGSPHGPPTPPGAVLH